MVVWSTVSAPERKAFVEGFAYRHHRRLHITFQCVRSFVTYSVEIVKRSDDMKGFVVLPNRWSVERPFSWLYKYRRLNKDYEFLTQSSESMLYIAMTHLMVRRIAKHEAF
ncbi:hypothetical protein C2W62_42590 [Candidatus Entotheonella serta]|nr:hypothetical protein C2W62_42590 [Candidatus Entotheonella serta]